MNSKFLALVWAFVALTAFGQQTPSYSDAEAEKHAGENATVTGKVFGVTTTGKGTTFINLGARFPKHTFVAVIFGKNQDAIGDVKQYEGKEVAITGKIELSPTDKKPQIIINKADQIKLAGPASPSAPPAPAAPTPAPASVATTTPVPATPAAVPPAAMSPSEAAVLYHIGKIELAGGWNSPRRDGEMTRKDLAKLFGGSGLPGESTRADTSVEIYPGIPFLTPLKSAKRTLNLEGTRTMDSKVATPGLPRNSFNAHLFEGVFPGGFDRLYLITDASDQVVSLLLVESSSRTRVTNEPDGNGYHTYNFVTGDGKAASNLVVKHQVTPPSAPGGVVLVETLLVDPSDPEKDAQGRPVKAKKGESAKPKTGKVLERSRWYVPAPLVSLILRCVGG
jgi:hypothetical protein